MAHYYYRTGENGEEVDPFLDRAETAEYLRIALEEVDALTASGVLLATEMGYYLGDLDDYRDRETRG